MSESTALLEQIGILPVIRLEDAEKAVPLGKALLAGGIQGAEITFRTPCAAKAIENLTRELPELYVCAGTVLNVAQAKVATACGAKAIISPGTNRSVVDWCINQQYPVYPGCATPTEVEAAMSLGLSAVKLFPAKVVGGVAMLKALYGPYSSMKFMPTGGITVENVREYLSQPNVLAVGGTWLCPESAIANEDWSAIEALCRAASQLVHRIRESDRL